MTHKFSTNTELKKPPIATGDSVLAKSFAWSKEWGIGCNANDTRSNHPHTFPREGMLGAVQMLVREESGGKPMSYKTKLCHLNNTHGQNIQMPPWASVYFGHRCYPNDTVLFCSSSDHLVKDHLVKELATITPRAKKNKCHHGGVMSCSSLDHLVKDHLVK